MLAAGQRGDSGEWRFVRSRRSSLRVLRLGVTRSGGDDRVAAGTQLAGVTLSAGVSLVVSVVRVLMVGSSLRRFMSDETGQDLIEYSLLLASIALAGAAAFVGMSSSVNSIWSAANSRLAAANGS
jgi:Flp pilus assembly pilin Flp